MRGGLQVPLIAGSAYLTAYIVLCALSVLNWFGDIAGARIILLINPLVYVFIFVHSWHNLTCEIVLFLIGAVSTFLLATFLCILVKKIWEISNLLVAVPLAIYSFWVLRVFGIA